MGWTHRSDLGGADIAGTDFSNALLDRTQQIALCRYADGTNSVTGVDTRKSLGACCQTLSCMADPNTTHCLADLLLSSLPTSEHGCEQVAAAGGGSGKRARPTLRGRRWRTTRRRLSSNPCPFTGSDGFIVLLLLSALHVM